MSHSGVNTVQTKDFHMYLIIAQRTSVTHLAFLYSLILQIVVPFFFFFATRTFSSYIDKELHSYLTLTLPRISPAPATVKIPLTGWEKWLTKVTTAVCSLLRMTEFSSATWKSWVCQDFWKSSLNISNQYIWYGCCRLLESIACFKKVRFKAKRWYERLGVLEAAAAIYITPVNTSV